MKKRQVVAGIMIIFIVGVGLIVITPTALAKTNIGSVVCQDGTQKQKISITGVVELVHSRGQNTITVKESDGTSYEVFLGPRWYKDTSVKVGEQVKIEGIEFKEGKISAWKLVKGDNTEIVIRDKNGKPNWAGKRKEFKERGYRGGLRGGFHRK